MINRSACSRLVTLAVIALSSVVSAVEPKPTRLYAEPFSQKRVLQSAGAAEVGICWGYSLLWADSLSMDAKASQASAKGRLSSFGSAQHVQKVQGVQSQLSAARADLDRLMPTSTKRQRIDLRIKQYVTMIPSFRADVAVREPESLLSNEFTSVEAFSEYLGLGSKLIEDPMVYIVTLTTAANGKHAVAFGRLGRNLTFFDPNIGEIGYSGEFAKAFGEGVNMALYTMNKGAVTRISVNAFRIPPPLVPSRASKPATLTQTAGNPPTPNVPAAKPKSVLFQNCSVLFDNSTSSPAKGVGIGWTKDPATGAPIWGYLAGTSARSTLIRYSMPKVLVSVDANGVPMAKGAWGSGTYGTEAVWSWNAN